MGRKATGKCVRPVMVNLPVDLGDRLYNQFMDIYITCGGHSGHDNIAIKLGTAPEKLQQYIDRELPVSQKQIDAISRIME